jgi:flagellar biosynthesis protein
MEHRPRRRAAALQYEQKVGPPTLLAKGDGILAEKILAVAQEHGVPIHHDPVLVEALSRLELGEQIPSELFLAVAAVIGFIYRMKAQQEA